MFDKDVYNKLLRTYVDAILHQEEHSLSNSAKRDVSIAKASLDTYITDYISDSNTTVCCTDILEPLHHFFRD